MPIKCDCSSEGKISNSYCRICGKYLRNSFLAEPSPQSSPMRQLIKKIYNQNQIKGKFFEVSGTTLWESIADAIKKSDICFYDCSNEIFNVAFEMGYAIGYVIKNWSSIGKRKKIVLLSKDSASDLIFKIMLIRPSLPHSNTFLNQTKNYKKNGKLDSGISKYAQNRIIRCENALNKVLFDKPFEEGVRHVFGQNQNWDLTKTRKEDILILTNKDYINNFNKEKQNTLIEDSKIIIEDVDIYYDPLGQMCYFIKRIVDQIVKKYDFLIVHLLGNDTDNVSDAKDHNFKVGVIAGIIRGCKEGYEADYFLVHNNNPTQFLRCSDISIKRYKSHDNISNIVNARIIDNRIIPQRL
jgi:hypothetical protein